MTREKRFSRRCAISSLRGALHAVRISGERDRPVFTRSGEQLPDSVQRECGRWRYER